MKLQSIAILNYKNLREVTLDFSPNINCLIGNNGVGKTNLLDAIYYLSFCRSSNNLLDSQLVTHNEDLFTLEGKYIDDDGERQELVQCGFRRGHRKSFRINRKPYKRLTEHIGQIPLILATPQDSLLVEAGSDERRKFMDIVIAQYDPIYVESLATYNKALQQRNALLKADNEPDPDLMDILEGEMATHGQRVYERRESFVSEFVPYFQRIYQEISSAKERVEVTYRSHAQRGDLKEVISGGRTKDRLLGYSLHGIHRDDLELFVDGYRSKTEGSQGQNKTMVLSMKLAQFEFLRRTISRTTPLLLLDDIFDKLDAERVEKIVSLVASDSYGQIFVTDTNRDHLDTILRTSHLAYSLFHVEGGQISKL